MITFIASVIILSAILFKLLKYSIKHFSFLVFLMIVGDILILAFAIFGFLYLNLYTFPSAEAFKLAEKEIYLVYTLISAGVPIAYILLLIKHSHLRSSSETTALVRALAKEKYLNNYKKKLL